jgi:hypothetical protein
VKDVFMREEEYSSKDLDHLGIVSAMCDEVVKMEMYHYLLKQLQVILQIRRILEKHCWN